MSFESRAGRPPLLLTRIAALVAVGLVTGLALSAIPNVELVTAVCFIAGFLLGPSAGLLTGGLTEVLFAGFHPMGSSFGPILIAQVLGMALAGLCGAGAAAFSRNLRKGYYYTAVVTGGGLVATAVFDLLTNLAYPITAGFSSSQFAVSMVAAIPFAAIHLLSNGLVFILLVVPLLPRLEKVMKVT
jgi:energy-coupling factor transport system substrate-specific component